MTCRVMCYMLSVLDQYDQNGGNQEFDTGGETEEECLEALVGIGLSRERIVIVVTDFSGIFSVTWQVFFF